MTSKKIGRRRTQEEMELLIDLVKDNYAYIFDQGVKKCKNKVDGG